MKIKQLIHSNGFMIATNILVCCFLYYCINVLYALKSMTLYFGADLPPVNLFLFSYDYLGKTLLYTLTIVTLVRLIFKKRIGASSLIKLKFFNKLLLIGVLVFCFFVYLVFLSCYHCSDQKWV